MPFIINGDVVQDGDPRIDEWRRRTGTGTGPTANTSTNTNSNGARRQRSATAASSAATATGGRGGGGGSSMGAIAPMPVWVRPGTGLGDLNVQLCAYLKPFPMAGVMVEPIYLAIAAGCAFLFGLRGFMLAALVIFFTTRNQ